MTQIKLCGLRRETEILCVNRLRPQYVGFMFYEKSRRFVTHAQANALRRMLSPGIRAVGVFPDNSGEEILQLAKQGVIDLIQLHGPTMDETLIQRLREATDLPIIRAFRISSEEDVREAQGSAADYILMDSGSGGTGKPFDWDLLREVSRPYFLAGGLCPENVGEAIKTLRPFAVDVSTGIETDGMKDPGRMEAFMRAVRGTA